MYLPSLLGKHAMWRWQFVFQDFSLVCFYMKLPVKNQGKTKTRQQQKGQQQEHLIPTHHP